MKEAKTFLVEPYCVKMSAQRWYMLARNVDYNYLRLYSLDRIEGVNLTDAHFVLPKDFCAKEYFAEYFGIVLDESVPASENSVKGRQMPSALYAHIAVASLAKEIYACDDYADFELALRPTYDFYMKLMSFGNMIKVLEPKSLQEKIYKWLEKTIEVYK